MCHRGLLKGYKIYLVLKYGLSMIEGFISLISKEAVFQIKKNLLKL